MVPLKTIAHPSLDFSKCGWLGCCVQCHSSDLSSRLILSYPGSFLKMFGDQVWASCWKSRTGRTVRSLSVQGAANFSVSLYFEFSLENERSRCCAFFHGAFFWLSDVIDDHLLLSSDRFSECCGELCSVETNSVLSDSVRVCAKPMVNLAESVVRDGGRRKRVDSKLSF